MKLVVYDVFVQAYGDRDEMKTLREILHIKNPKAQFAGDRVNQKQPEYFDFIDDEGRFLRGILPQVAEKLGHAGVMVEYQLITDDYESRPFELYKPELLPNVTPRDYQIPAAQNNYYYRRGHNRIATGGGKTLVAAMTNAMIEHYANGSTLTMVNKKHLLHQTVEAFERYGLKNVGLVGDGLWRPNRHTVAMVQTLRSALRSGDETFADGIEAITWDETHHLGAPSWAGIAYRVPSKWSIGLSGTPYRDGYESWENPADIQMLAITGPLLIDIPPSYLIERGFLARPHIFFVPVDPADCYKWREQNEEPTECNSNKWIKVEQFWISENGYRTHLMVRLARKLVDRGLHPLILVSRLEHGKELVRKLVGVGLNPIFLSGGPLRHTYDPSQKDKILTEECEDTTSDTERFSAGGEGAPDVLIGSTVFDEGVDLPAVAALINGSGGKSFVKNFQRVGRGLRPKPGTNEAYIFDFVDHGHNWTLRHSYARMSDYASEPAYRVYEGYGPTCKFFGESW